MCCALRFPPIVPCFLALKVVIVGYSLLSCAWGVLCSPVMFCDGSCPVSLHLSGLSETRVRPPSPSLTHTHIHTRAHTRTPQRSAAVVGGVVSSNAVIRLRVPLLQLSPPFSQSRLPHPTHNPPASVPTARLLSQITLQLQNSLMMTPDRSQQARAVIINVIITDISLSFARFLFLSSAFDVVGRCLPTLFSLLPPLPSSLSKPALPA